jgi:hypothetical protein
VLDRLHAETFFHDDHLEIMGYLPFDVDLPRPAEVISCPSPHVSRGLG